METNDDKIQYPKRVFLDVYNDPVYMTVIATADEYEERYRNQVLQQQAYRAEPTNLAPFGPPVPQFQPPQIAEQAPPEPDPLENPPSVVGTIPGTPVSISEVVDPLAAGISMEGVRLLPSSQYNMGSVFRANPVAQGSPLAPYILAERSSPSIPRWICG